MLTENAASRLNFIEYNVRSTACADGDLKGGGFIALA
jgi:hypothetical protein